VTGTPTDAKRRGRLFPLFLWLVGPLCELGGLFMIAAGMPDLMDDMAFGRPAIQVMAGYALAATVVGTALAWRGVSGVTRIVVAIALFVAAGLTATLGIAFLFAGPLAVFALLMAHSTLSIIMIGRAVLSPSTVGGRR
jgi:hypothetical protein